MVLKALTHRGQVVHHGHAHALEVFGVTDARELQQLRRVDRPTREDHLLVCVEGQFAAFLDAGHPSGAAVGQQDAGDLRVRHHRQVRPAHGRA